MKKVKGLMLAALAVFSIGGMFADEVTSGLAQVYQIKASIKTMTAAKAKIPPSRNLFVDETDVIVYRKPTTVTWYGLIWGCDCETLLGKWTVLPSNPDSVSGVVIWSASSPYDIVLLDDMRWHVLGAVDKTGTRCELAWTIGESTSDSDAFLAFSGFGTLNLKYKRVDGAAEVYCTSSIKSLSGTVAGWMPAPMYYAKGKTAVCTFCGIVESGTDDSYETAVSWNFCPCTLDAENDFTAVSGTWMLKYNASLSKRLASPQTPTITTAYTKFPPTVKAAIEKKIALVKAAED